jgi:hypothetical protein
VLASIRIPVASPEVNSSANRVFDSSVAFHHENFKFVASRPSVNGVGAAVSPGTNKNELEQNHYQQGAEGKHGR